VTNYCLGHRIVRGQDCQAVTILHSPLQTALLDQSELLTTLTVNCYNQQLSTPLCLSLSTATSISGTKLKRRTTNSSFNMPDSTVNCHVDHSFTVKRFEVFKEKPAEHLTSGSLSVWFIPQLPSVLRLQLWTCCQPVSRYVPFLAQDLSLFQVFSSLVPPSPTDWLLGKWIGMFLAVFGVVNLVKCPD